jgi:hypothetical protein
MAITQPAWLGAAIAPFAIGLAVLPLPRVRVGPAVHTLGGAIADPRNLTLIAIAGGAAMLAIAAVRVIAAPSRALGAGAALLCALTVTAIVDQSRIVFARVDNGPYRARVDRGFDAVVERLNALDPSAAILAPKEIGYYYRGPSYPLEDVGDGGDAAIVRTALQPDVRIIVDTDEGPARAVRAAIDGLTIEQVGSFVLYVK